MTSHDVVARLRRLAGTRKVGHAGTLDPMATGVLRASASTAPPGCSATSRSPRRRTTPPCGSAPPPPPTTPRGRPSPRRPTAHLDEQQVRTAAAAFVGDLEQRPSSVSAIKVDGKRAYARVRAGEDVDLPARPVTVHELRVGAVRREGDALDVDLSVRCSSGTYVRAIARDLGAALGVGGHLTALRRTAVGPFTLAEAHTLDALADDLAVLDLSEVARRCFPSLDLDDEQARDVGFGRKLAVRLEGAAPVAVFAPDGRFLALYERRGDLAAPVAVLT